MEKFKLSHQLGLGGVAIGTGFEAVSDQQARDVLNEAWNLGVRYYDTSPWYGLTKSERRFGEFLRQKNHGEFVFSTKIGRLFKPVTQAQIPATMWKAPLPYEYEHDYTGDAVMRSIDESLERTGLSHIDIVYVHDLSEDQVGDRYDYYLQQAKEGAFKVLSNYRDQGIIKAWGMGVNKIEPILDCLKYADPDICLSATQYSILEHEDAVDRLLPAVKKAQVQLVSGAGFNSGFITGRHRYNYKNDIPKGMTPKRDRIAKIAQDHGTDIVAVALQFILASQSFVSVIPGASQTAQVADNVRAVTANIPKAFWDQLVGEGLIYADAEVPG
ncbi:MAG: aldo/keto reductase [Rhizobacter sp.]|nr:aldo/keto reductase [Ferruginibacter sp.]